MNKMDITFFSNSKLLMYQANILTVVALLGARNKDKRAELC